MAHCEGFWATVELLVSLGRINDSNSQPHSEEIEDWLDNVSSKTDSCPPLSSRADSGKNIKCPVDYHPLIECNISHPLVKSRLEGLMGSNIVRLTDRKYMLKLMSKIKQDHEAKQQVRIEERMKDELTRTKMMILNRLIPIQDAPENIRDYPLFQLYIYCDAIIHGEYKKKTRKLVHLRESLYRMLYLNNEIDSEDAEADEDFYKRLTIGTENKMEEEQGIEDGYVLSQEDFDRIHYEADGVKSLREAKTVEEMYAMAHAVVGILNTHTDEGRHKQEISVSNEKNITDNEKIISGNENAQEKSR